MDLRLHCQCVWGKFGFIVKYKESVVFLAYEAANYIIGVTVVMDGGFIKIDII